MFSVQISCGTTHIAALAATHAEQDIHPIPLPLITGGFPVLFSGNPVLAGPHEAIPQTGSAAIPPSAAL